MNIKLWLSINFDKKIKLQMLIKHIYLSIWFCPQASICTEEVPDRKFLSKKH